MKLCTKHVIESTSLLHTIHIDALEYSYIGGRVWMRSSLERGIPYVGTGVDEKDMKAVLGLNLLQIRKLRRHINTRLAEEQSEQS